MLFPAAVDLLAASSSPLRVDDAGFDIARERRLSREAAATLPRPRVDEVVDVDADGVPCRLYNGSLDGPAVLYLHGGGWVFGDVEGYHPFLCHLAAATGGPVLAVDYRLAPEHRYPAPVDDAATAARWWRRTAPGSRADGGPVRRLAAAGDSAGGNLAAGLALREPGLVDALVLVYPCLDPTGGHPSYAVETGGLDAAEMDWFWRQYAPEGAPLPVADPVFAPSTAPDAALAALPPTLVITAEHDPLRDEAEAWAARVARTGVDVVSQRWLGMPHGFYRHPYTYAFSRRAIAQTAAWLGSLD